MHTCATYQYANHCRAILPMWNFCPNLTVTWTTLKPGSYKDNLQEHIISCSRIVQFDHLGTICTLENVVSSGPVSADVMLPLSMPPVLFFCSGNPLKRKLNRPFGFFARPYTVAAPQTVSWLHLAKDT